MIIERIVSPLLAQVSYIVGDDAVGVAVVIDPRRDIDVYLDWSARHQMPIVAVLETHIHADFVSGASALANTAGASLFRPGIASDDPPHDTPSMTDGQEISFGSLVLKALWTPGHTPEHMSYLLFDRESSPEPLAVFTGDALFVGEVGRPDLLGSQQTSELTNQLYETVTTRLAALPDTLRVYPGHGAGSSCGKSIGDAPWTTIGEQKSSNYAFNCNDLADFTAQVASQLPAPPPYYSRLKRENQTIATPSTSAPTTRSLSAEEVYRLMLEGAIVVDFRRGEAFGREHVLGSISLGMDGNYVQWLGWLDPHDLNLVAILDDPAEFEAVRVALARIGLDRLIGYLDGGVEAWRAAGYPLESLAEVDAAGLNVMLSSRPTSVQVLDIRTPEERSNSAIEGSSHLPATELVGTTDPPLTLDSPLAIICASGYRSRFIASLFLRRGISSIVNVRDGMNGWNALPSQPVATLALDR